MNSISRIRLQSLMQREQKRFVDERPKSKALFERARKSLLGGVPMNWMAKWAGAFPPFVREAQGAHFYDVDGHRYVDLCLGDTGAMTGHSPSATVKAVEEQVRRGITLMLPNEDAVFVGEELQKRFGLPYWQFALTATDANRFSIRLARQLTGRQKILVFHCCVLFVNSASCASSPRFTRSVPDRAATLAQKILSLIFWCSASPSAAGFLVRFTVSHRKSQKR